MLNTIWAIRPTSFTFLPLPFLDPAEGGGWGGSFFATWLEIPQTTAIDTCRVTQCSAHNVDACSILNFRMTCNWRTEDFLNKKVKKQRCITCHIWRTKVYALSRLSWCSGEVLSAMTASRVCARTKLSRRRTSLRLDKLCVNKTPWTPTRGSHVAELTSLFLCMSSGEKITSSTFEVMKIELNYPHFFNYNIYGGM